MKTGVSMIMTCRICTAFGFCSIGAPTKVLSMPHKGDENRFRGADE